MAASRPFVPSRALRLMLRIRFTEQVLIGAWRAGRVPGEYHSGIGEEGIVAGVLGHLGADDAVCADHRSTGPIVGRGVDLTAMMLEVLGSPAGMNGGQAGHMHLLSPDHRVTADGIVGSSAGFAAGHAVAAQHVRPGAVAVAFFGEGAVNSGTLLEAMNLAATWALPVLLVCKDNRWSITTRTADVTAGDPRDRARAMGIPVRSAAGHRVDQVHAAAGQLVAAARQGHGPGFLYATCHRPGGHFEGDPLLRILNDFRREAAALAPGVAEALRAEGGSRSDQGAGLATMGLRLARAAAERGRGMRQDPLVRARRLAGRDETRRAERIERETVVEAARAAWRVVRHEPRLGTPFVTEPGGAVDSPSEDAP